MDILLAPVYFLFAHQFLGTALFAVLGFFGIRLASKRQGALPGLAKNYGFVLLLTLSLLKMFVGHGVAVYLVHAIGLDARGIVTDTYTTSTVYNNQRVNGFTVLLALSDGRTLEEHFRTDSFNVYPPHNATSYPGVGEHFDAKYLAHFPSAFIILTNGNGGFAQDLQCDQLRKALHADELKHQFAPANRQFLLDTITALERYRAEHCAITPEANDDDAEEMQQLLRARDAAGHLPPDSF